LPIIRKLDGFTVNQIAAGEIVERPASIVKELIENSIDADSSAITIEIENGGTSLIRVTDNGTGMDREDAVASFERHATSKITGADDLNCIHTLGFRGEALASISSVSQMEMITRQRGALSGYHIINHGGQIKKIREAGCPEGTTILVKNLFFNTPARLKFLKSTRSETAAISELIAKQILAHPEVSIKYISNNRIIYHSPGNGDLMDAVISIYGKDIKNQVMKIETDSEDEGISIRGYLGKPSLSRTNRNHQSFFVNRRYIRSQLLSNCVEEAAKDHLMINHFPWCVLDIQIPSQDVDVNVHPAKTEIRFRKPDEVYQSLMLALRIALDEKPHVPTIEIKPNSKETVQLDAFTPIKHDSSDKLAETNGDSIGCKSYSANSYMQIQENIPSQIQEEMQSKPIYINKAAFNKNISESSMKAEEDDNTINAYDFMKLNIIGSAFSTFILAESENELFIIDQHAAHERLIYERLKDSVNRQEVASQQLLPPYVLEVTHDEYLTIMDNLTNFLSIGFEIEPFGGKSYLIRGVPVIIREINIRELFHDLLDQSDLKSGNTRISLQQEDIIRISCKKAVKANDKLSTSEIRSLLGDLNQKKIPFTCPHGRPILISMSRYELEKKFKRIQ